MAVQQFQAKLAQKSQRNAHQSDREFLRALIMRCRIDRFLSDRPRSYVGFVVGPTSPPLNLHVLFFLHTARPWRICAGFCPGWLMFFTGSVLGFIGSSSDCNVLNMFLLGSVADFVVLRSGLDEFLSNSWRREGFSFTSHGRGGFLWYFLHSGAAWMNFLHTCTGFPPVYDKIG
jgi:hypothetical protein